MSQETLVFTDKCGRVVQVGDLIVYGHALGRCAGLRYGKALRIVSREKGYESDGNSKLQVIGVDDDWGHRVPELLTRKSYLKFPARVLVVSRDQIPKQIFDLLDSFSD